MNPLDLLSATDRRRVLALVELELELERRHPTEALLAREPSGGSTRAWLEEAQAHIGLATGLPRAEVHRTMAELAQSYQGLFVGRASELVVTRAALRRLRDWAALSAPDRQAAIQQELEDELRRDLDLVLAAAEAHGLPVAAPELSLPPKWTYASADRFLIMLAELGILAYSSERRRGWPIYEAPPPNEVVPPGTPDAGAADGP
jgi:hypothetical protein